MSASQAYVLDLQCVHAAEVTSIFGWQTRIAWTAPPRARHALPYKWMMRAARMMDDPHASASQQAH